LVRFEQGFLSFQITFTQNKNQEVTTIPVKHPKSCVNYSKQDCFGVMLCLSYLSKTERGLEEHVHSLFLLWSGFICKIGSWKPLRLQALK